MMYKEDYEKYYQTGGSYIIPVEIFNELFDEYECFKNEYQKYKEVIDKLKKRLLDLSYLNDELIDRELLDILKEVE